MSADIAQIQYIRHAVRENRRSGPKPVTNADYEEYITRRGKGWVCETDGQIVGFAIKESAKNCTISCWTGIFQ